MKASTTIIMGLVLALVCGGLLGDAAASPAPQRTPVVCNAGNFYFGQNLVLATAWLETGERVLYKAAGAGWQALSPPAGWNRVRVARDGTIYLLDFDPPRPIYRSTDGGETWELMGEDTPQGMLQGGIYPSPLPDVVFLGVRDLPWFWLIKGVYKSTDGGATWKWVLGGGDGMWVDFSPDFARDGVAFAALYEYRYSRGVWKTEDWGETWFPVHDGLYIGGGYGGYLWTAVSPYYAWDRTVFAGDGSSGVYKSTNGGLSWVRIKDPIIQGWIFSGPPALSPFYLQDQTLLLGPFLSQDGGLSWQRIRDDEGHAWGIRSASSPPLAQGADAGTRALELWYVGKNGYHSDCYLYRSYDLGTTWEEVVIAEANEYYLPLVVKPAGPNFGRQTPTPAPPTP